MKKLTLILMIVSVTAVTSLSAQTREATTEIPALKLSDGKNTVRIPNGSGSFQFVKRADSFSNVVFIGADGSATRLVAIPGSSGGKLPTPCKHPIPDACFGIPNSSQVAMCMCKPGDKSGGEYTITFKEAKLTARKSGGRQEHY